MFLKTTCSVNHTGGGLEQNKPNGEATEVVAQPKVVTVETEIDGLMLYSGNGTCKKWR